MREPAALLEMIWPDAEMWLDGLLLLSSCFKKLGAIIQEFLLQNESELACTGITSCFILKDCGPEVTVTVFSFSPTLPYLCSRYCQEVLGDYILLSDDLALISFLFFCFVL